MSTTARLRACQAFAFFCVSLHAIHAFDDFQVFPPHHVMRRSVSEKSPSLQVDLYPVVHNVTYYNIGDKIHFRLNLTHNQSAPEIAPDASLKVTLVSEFLTPRQSSVDPSPLSNLATNDTALYFEVVSLTSAEELSVTFEAEVRSSIHPLANLFFSVHVTGHKGGSEYWLGPVSSKPVLYAVFPKVTLSRPSHQDMWIKSSTRYAMTIVMPHLDFSLLVELSTAINDFSFMEVHDVTIDAVGSNIAAASGGNRNPVPTYEKSDGGTFADRAILDFGNLSVSGFDEPKNKIDIGYNVTIRDHPDLFNGSKHWVGAGMRSGYQMLWVGQEAMYIYKHEPTLKGVVTALNDTITKRYFIGDEVKVEWRVNHTNNSYDEARDVNIEFSSNTLDIVSGIYERGEKGENAIPGNHKIPVGTLPQGDYVTGSLALKVTDNISPLENLDIILTLSYKNRAGEAKMTTTHKPMPPFMAGVPGFSLTLDEPTNHIAVGGRAQFTFKITLRKMKSPLKLQIILPVNQTSIMALTEVKVLSVGTNIENRTALSKAQPELKSTVGDPKLPDRADIDFGMTESTVGTDDTADNQIIINFGIIVNDHLNVTNGSKFWVAVGVRGGERMIWVGETALVANVPDERRPVLKVTANCYVPGTGMPCQSKALDRGGRVYYNASVEHAESGSQRYVDQLNVLWMVPPFVKFDSLLNADQLHHQSIDANQVFQFNDIFHFKDRMSFSFSATLDPDNRMPSGKTYAVSPISLVYRAYRSDQQYQAPIYPVVYSFTVPGEDWPGSSLSQALPEMYTRGFMLHKPTNHLYLCQLSRDSSKPSCFYTQDEAASWTAMELQVGCVIGQSGDVLYAVSNTKRAYMQQTARNGAWYAITQSAWNEAKAAALADAAFVKEPFRALPPATWVNSTTGSSWTATDDGLYRSTAPPGGQWAKKASWKCCS